MAKLTFVEKCDQCGKLLSVGRVRNFESMNQAINHGYAAAFGPDGTPVFFCSIECQGEFEAENP